MKKLYAIIIVADVGEVEATGLIVEKLGKFLEKSAPRGGCLVYDPRCVSKHWKTSTPI
jgi:hypothetical protein